MNHNKIASNAEALEAILLSVLFFDFFPVFRRGLLGLVGTGTVKYRSLKVVWEVFLCYVMIFVIVRIFIALEKGTLQVRGEVDPRALFCVFCCRCHSNVG